MVSVGGHLSKVTEELVLFMASHLPGPSVCSFLPHTSPWRHGLFTLLMEEDTEATESS